MLLFNVIFNKLLLLLANEKISIEQVRTAAVLTRTYIHTPSRASLTFTYVLAFGMRQDSEQEMTSLFLSFYSGHPFPGFLRTVVN